MTFTTKERWTLSEGGEALKVQRSVETPMGTDTVKLTFRKGQAALQTQGSKTDQGLKGTSKKPERNLLTNCAQGDSLELDVRLLYYEFKDPRDALLVPLHKQTPCHFRSLATMAVNIKIDGTKLECL